MTTSKLWASPTNYDIEKSIARTQDPWPECPVCGTMPDREGTGYGTFRCINRACPLNQRPIRGLFWRSGIFYRAMRLVGCPDCDAPFNIILDENLMVPGELIMQLKCAKCTYRLPATVSTLGQMEDKLERSKALDALVRSSQTFIASEISKRERFWVDRCEVEKTVGGPMRTVGQILNGNLTVRTDGSPKYNTQEWLEAEIRKNATAQAAIKQNVSTTADTGVADRARALMFWDED